MSEKGRRYNKGKLRYVLFPEFAKKCIIDVYTKGAHKYSIYEDNQGNKIKGVDIPFERRAEFKLIDDASGNWRKGFSWMETLDSINRHEEAFKSGEDFDPELLTYHAANAAWGWISILEFYKIYPQGDDRNHLYLNRPKIGLDIDEVICDWVGAWTKLHNLQVPKCWFFDRDIMKKFEDMRQKGTLDEFYLSLKPRVDPSEIPFEPFAYVTSRPVSTEITEKWLDLHNFPSRPVITVPTGTSKVDVIKNLGIEIFIDDRFDNFTELNNAGVCCYLWDAPHNQRYSVGYKRLKSFNDLF